MSNSENLTDGGVGAITFNSQGQVINYQRILRGTRRNCGGGKTFWKTWMTCEEVPGGQVWEVDPWGRRPGRQTIMGKQGAMYESAAYDNRNPSKPTFYITTDEYNGPLIRFTPDPAEVQYALLYKDYGNLLHRGTNFKTEYFYITFIDETTGKGTYVWTTDIAAGRASAGTW